MNQRCSDPGSAPPLMDDEAIATGKPPGPGKFPGASLLRRPKGEAPPRPPTTGVVRTSAHSLHTHTHATSKERARRVAMSHDASSSQPRDLDGAALTEGWMSFERGI
ncbi:hypothetical protein MTO96_035950 [Rhipicephalus appendiculatus]